MIGKYVLGWFGLLVAAMVNGALRDFAYKPYVGEMLAHQISCFTGIALFALLIGLLTKRWQLKSSRQAWIVGLLWLTMTISFEFLFFHYVRGVAWSILLHDYNVFDGRLWILVLVWVTIAPRVFWRLQQPK
jgi:hypothetical protein